MQPVLRTTFRSSWRESLQGSALLRAVTFLGHRIFVQVLYITELHQKEPNDGALANIF